MSQVATVVGELLTTFGAVNVVVEMSDSEETPEKERAEVLAEVSGGENASYQV